MDDRGKESKAFIKNGSGSNGKKINNKTAEISNNHHTQALNYELRKLKRYIIALFAAIVVCFLVIIITFSVLYSNLKWDVKNHDHPPKVGTVIGGILDGDKNAELCLACDEVRLGPSLEEERMLDNLVRKPKTTNQKEQCCVETPEQLLRMLRLLVDRRIREEIALGTLKVEAGTSTEPGEEKPAAHLLGSVSKQQLPAAPSRLFPISHWISDEDVAFYNKVQYRHGRLVIIEAGLYFVYSQLSFLEVFDRADTGSQSLSHYIYRYNIIYRKGGEELLLQNSITKCWGENKSFGEYTSYLGAVLNLRQGDEVFVKASNLTLIVREPKLNYFGLYKVN